MKAQIALKAVTGERPRPVILAKTYQQQFYLRIAGQRWKERTSITVKHDRYYGWFYV